MERSQSKARDLVPCSVPGPYKNGSSSVDVQKEPDLMDASSYLISKLVERSEVLTAMQLEREDPWGKHRRPFQLSIWFQNPWLVIFSILCERRCERWQQGANLNKHDVR